MYKGRFYTKRPKWRLNYGSVAPVWEVTDDGLHTVTPQRRRYIGGNCHQPDYWPPCWWFRRQGRAEIQRKEEILMATSKNWDKASPAGAGNRISRKNVLQGQLPVRVIEKRNEEEDLLSAIIVAPRDLGIKLLGAVDGLIRKYQALKVPVKFGFEQDSGDVYLMTIKVEDVPVQSLHQVKV